MKNNIKVSAISSVNMINRKAAKASIALGALVASGLSHAAIDTTAVSTALSEAETSAHTVGTVVIGVVAGLAVVGIIIGLVKKL